MGIVILEMINTIPPYFEEDSIKVMISVIRNPAPTIDSYPAPFGVLQKKISKELVSFLSLLLCKDVEKRYNTCQLLNHKYLKKVKPIPILS